MKTLVIQGKTATNAHGLPFFIPAQEYGIAAIESVDYHNWFSREKDYNYVMTDNRTFRSGGAGAPEGIDYNYLTRNHVPIGSVEFVLDWLRLMGAAPPKPLNIPEELFKFVSRDVAVDVQGMRAGKWFVKSTHILKDRRNDVYESDGLGVFGTEKVFMTRYIENVVSEWRIFVLDKKVLGIRCYSGDEWVLPDKQVVDSIVNAYDKRCYTLDVMVYDSTELSFTAGGMVTDIVELHDFFSCGLYGFEDYRYLVRMWCIAINELLCVKE